MIDILTSILPIKNFLWFIIYMDEKIPDKIADNIVIFKVYGNLFNNIFTWIKFIFLNIRYIFKGSDFFYTTYPV